MKRIVILGSTGSIGTGTLDVIRTQPEDFRVIGLAAGKNRDLLFRQIQEFKPNAAVMADEDQGRLLRKSVGKQPEIWWGPKGLDRLASLPDVDLLVSAIPGIEGLLPTLTAIKSGKTIALASKEILVAAGEVVMPLARKKGASILPVDSEHSAIFQCLRGERKRDVRKIILTASGGPFLGAAPGTLKKVTPDQALDHPRWKMGAKVSLDSATMMNKGLEVLEAAHLFDIEIDRIEVVIHPQSIIHSMVEMGDGSIIAQLSEPDMRLPISYALNYPARGECVFSPTSLFSLGSLTFRRPDRNAFPALDLAYRAGREGGTLPAVMNAANEVAGEAFLDGRIAFPQIMRVVTRVMNSHSSTSKPDLGGILAADRDARRKAQSLIDCQDEPLS